MVSDPLLRFLLDPDVGSMQRRIIEFLWSRNVFNPKDALGFEELTEGLQCHRSAISSHINALKAFGFVCLLKDKNVKKFYLNRDIIEKRSQASFINRDIVAKKQELPAKESKKPSVNKEMQEIFDFFNEQLEKNKKAPKRSINSKRKTAMKQMLDHSSVEDIKKAIVGFFKARKDQGIEYLDLDYVNRHFETYLAKGPKTQVEQGESEAMKMLRKMQEEDEAYYSSFEAQEIEFAGDSSDLNDNSGYVATRGIKNSSSELTSVREMF